MSTEWEDKFKSWASPPSESEQTRCNNAEQSIRKAIGLGKLVDKATIKVFPQGSYLNRTNVRLNSDVDICVLCTSSLFYDLPEGKTPKDFGITVPAKYPYSEFKPDVEGALVSYFGRPSVRTGNKAFEIHANTYRVDSDAVACFEYRLYKEDGSYLTGAAFLPQKGEKIVNWPEQNYNNGVRKNDATNRRFKAIVRILKKLRDEMEENNIEAAKSIPSFLIECLCWNVPNESYNHATYSATVRAVLAHLFNNTIKFDDSGKWGEINELHYLFHKNQPWTWAQTHNFLGAAWDYLGLK